MGPRRCPICVPRSCPIRLEVDGGAGAGNDPGGGPGHGGGGHGGGSGGGGSGGGGGGGPGGIKFRWIFDLRTVRAAFLRK